MKSKGVGDLPSDLSSILCCGIFSQIFVLVKYENKNTNTKRLSMQIERTVERKVRRRRFVSEGNGEGR